MTEPLPSTPSEMPALGSLGLRRFSGFHIALQSYVQRIAVHPRRSHPTSPWGRPSTTSRLSSPRRWGHDPVVGGIIPAVGGIIPAAGGIIWEAVGSQHTFILGLGIDARALIPVQWMRVETRHTPVGEEAG